MHVASPRGMLDATERRLSRRESVLSEGAMGHGQPEVDHHGPTLRRLRSNLLRVERWNCIDDVPQLRNRPVARPQVGRLRWSSRCRLDREHEHSSGRQQKIVLDVG